MAVLGDTTAHGLAEGELEALFLPRFGMLGASLRHRGIELLRRIDDLELARDHGSTAGIPLLYPWANRLAGFRYRAAGRDVQLDANSSLLRLDATDLPIHGVPWSMLSWEVIAATTNRLAARLDWTKGELLAIFPFPHHVEMTVSLEPNGLTVQTTVIADGASDVPASFGFHPYLGLPGIPREQWRLTMPSMLKMVLDERRIPTGAEEPFAAMDQELDQLDFDDGYLLGGENASLTISGGGRRISVELLAGYRYAQVYAPIGRDFIALEPMTAPTDALVSGRDLGLVQSGARFSAVFRIGVETI